MSWCPRCRSPVAEGALFCPVCGAVVLAPVGATPVAAVPGTGGALPNPSGRPVPTPAPPPADWIPPALLGRARHCPRCNTLISSVAVACPVCGAGQQPPGADGAADAPGR
ncbi:MAG: zinc-ribbon domain-containing protein [Thermoplasmata archaeon]